MSRTSPIPCLLFSLAPLALAACTTTAGLDSLRRPELCESGRRVEVAWPERLYPAVVARDLDETGMCLVTYETEERRWSERVVPRRVFGRDGGSGAGACRAGTEVFVDWAGAQWYQATVRDGPDSKGRCPIHYVDYEEAWDESVPLERLRASRD